MLNSETMQPCVCPGKGQGPIGLFWENLLGQSPKLLSKMHTQYCYSLLPGGHKEYVAADDMAVWGLDTHVLVPCTLVVTPEKVLLGS